MDMLQFCKDLYKVPRSITGRGVQETLNYIKNIIPIEIQEVYSGTKVYDWVVPPEWNINDAYIIEMSTGRKLCSIKENNLHLMGYSHSIDTVINFTTLEEHLHYLINQPDAIPYVTSYYERNWAFCISYEEFKNLDRTSLFRVFIDSTHDNEGKLHYGELVIQGKSNEELFFSSYICHPQMVNNELSGPAVITALAKSILNSNCNYYTYRFVFVPETIGSIVYLSKHLKNLKKNVLGGYVVTCVGDERSWGIISSRLGNNFSDKIAEFVLENEELEFIKYSWLERGSDERQYCWPGVDLPISSICRSKYGKFKEYHTSLDNFDLVTSKGLEDSLRIYKKCLEVFNYIKIYPISKFYCEPQLGKRGLYPNISTAVSGKAVAGLMNFLSFCDGTNNLMDISKKCDLKFDKCKEYYNLLILHDLIYLQNEFNIYE
jgi:aminopeptidase-like protein